MNEEAKMPDPDAEGSLLEQAVLASLPEFVEFANTVADTARSISLGYFRADPELLIKSDGSPVTVADRETERVIRDMLSRSYPQHAVIGEEYGWAPSDQPYTWVVDPIDGTKSYLAGAPTYGMLLALLYNGTPVLGVIDIPALDERWCGAVGQTTTMNGQPVKTRACTAVEQAVLTIISPDYLKDGERLAVDELSRIARVRRYSSDGYSHPLLASGYVDMVVAVGQQPFDYLAVIAVVEGAGGCITDWAGRPLDLDSDGRILVTATGELHQQALSVLQATEATDI
jgi:inositol-phosphate phosphatase/L-galactose 1-phosphate phosphatase/histidinol-phosphatase